MVAPRKVEFSIGAIDRTRRVLRRVRNGFRSLGRAITSFRGLVVGVFAGAAVRGLAHFAERLENIQDTAEGLGLTAEQFQALKFAAEEVGVSGRDVETVFQRLSRRAGQAADGNDQLLEKFELLGISLADLETSSPLELFDRMLGALRKFPKAVAEARIADILDTEGLRLLRRINPEFENFADILAKAKAGGAILDKQTLARMEEAAKTLREFSNKLTLEFAPVLANFVSQITPFIPGLIEALQKMATALVAAIPIITRLARNANPLGPIQAANRAGQQLRQDVTSGGFTAGGRLMQLLIAKVEELVNLNRRAEARANRPDSGVYGP